MALPALVAAGCAPASALTPSPSLGSTGEGSLATWRVANLERRRTPASPLSQLDGRGGQGVRDGDHEVPLSRTSPSPSVPAEARRDGGLVGYVFNAKSRDVTLFDPFTREVLETRPLGAVVRWLSNEQRFWDGQHIWTYDFPDNAVQALAIDPREVAVARTLPTGGEGPAHSLMLAPDFKTAWVNVAGGDYLAVLDTGSGEVIDEITTGKFP